MTDSSDIMKCYECGTDKHVLKLSPAVIDDKLKLVCAECWRSAVETGRAYIFTQEELGAFSEFKTEEEFDPSEEPEDILDSKIIG